MRKMIAEVFVNNRSRSECTEDAIRRVTPTSTYVRHPQQRNGIFIFESSPETENELTVSHVATDENLYGVSFVSNSSSSLRVLRTLLRTYEP